MLQQMEGEVITLLDGKTWEMDDILKKMWDDSFYYGYLGKAALSSSSFKKLTISVEEYQKSLVERNDSPALKIGRLTHHAVLQPELVGQYYEFVDCKTRGSKIYKEAVLESPREVFLEKDKIWSDNMKDAVYSHETASALLLTGMAEVPAIDYVQGLPVRAKADWLRDDCIVDLKTTSSIDDFDYNCTVFGYDIQAYLYTKIFRRQFFIFIAVDKKTFKVKVVQATKEMIDEGERKVAIAVQNYINEYF
jgi:hypothetical protein